MTTNIELTPSPSLAREGSCSSGKVYKPVNWGELEEGDKRLLVDFDSAY